MIKNIVLIGYGKIGKRYLAILKQKKKVNTIILRKKKIISKKIKFINSLKNVQNVDGVIIASPLNTHYEYAKYFLKKRVPILLEKPICENLRQAKKLQYFSNTNKTSLIINYSDLYDPNLIKLLNYISKEKNKIKVITMNYGNNRNKYKKSKPIEDWLPHPVAVITSLLKVINFKCIDYVSKFNSKKKEFFEKLIIKFIFKKKKLILNFSNFPKTNMRNIYIETDNFSIYFDAYNKKNNYFLSKNLKKKVNIKKNSFENITNNFLNIICKNLYTSNIKLGINEMKLTSKILKEIKKSKHTLF